MARENRYFIRSRISEAKFRRIIRLFALDLEATKIAVLSGISRNSINKILKAVRKIIAQECEKEAPFKGSVEVDESYFGARRQRGLRGRGAKGKVIVFGLYKRNGKVYTQVVSNVSRAALQGIIKGKVALESVIHSDGFRSYNGLVDLGYRKHYRVDHGGNEFAYGANHINGIENFWGIAKVRLAKFRGLSRSTFHLHLKETEFRFNHRKEDLYKLLLKLLRQNPIKLS